MATTELTSGQHGQVWSFEGEESSRVRGKDAAGCALRVGLRQRGSGFAWAFDNGGAPSTHLRRGYGGRACLRRGYGGRACLRRGYGGLGAGGSKPPESYIYD